MKKKYGNKPKAKHQYKINENEFPSKRKKLDMEKDYLISEQESEVIVYECKDRNINFKKSSLNSLRIDLTIYLSKFVYLCDVRNLLNINKRIRLVIFKNVKIITPYFKFLQYLKSKKLETEVDLLCGNEYNIFKKFLHEQNFSSEEIESLLYSILKSVSKKDFIEISKVNESNLYFFNRILTSDFSVCKILSISLYNTEITEQFVNYFCSIIFKNNSIIELNMDHCSFNQDISRIFNSLESNTTIRILRVSKLALSHYGYEKIHTQNIMSLFRVIETSNTIEKFCFQLGLTDNRGLEYEAFTKMIENNKSVKHMKLSYYYDNSKKYDFSFLSKNETLEILDLSETDMKVIAFKSLYLNLKVQRFREPGQVISKIHTLILRGIRLCNFNYKCFEYLGLLINSNPLIQKIDLSENNEHTLNLREFIKALENNFSLKILLLEKCNIEQEDFIRLIYVLKNNRCLEEVDVTNSKKYIYAKGKVLEMLNVNYSLKHFRFDNSKDEKNQVEQILFSRNNLVNKGLNDENFY